MAAEHPVELPLARCTLDAPELEAQLGRYRTLASAVAAAEREPGRLRVTFGPDADLGLVRETVETERACCSFFAIELDDRVLSIGVADPAMAPAVDAIAYSLGV